MERRTAVLAGGAALLAAVNIAVLSYVALSMRKRVDEAECDDASPSISVKPNDKSPRSDLRYKKQKEHFDRETHEWFSRDEEELSDEQKEALNKLLFLVKMRFGEADDPAEVFCEIRSLALADCLRAVMKDCDEVFDSKPLVHTHDLFRSLAKLRELAKTKQAKIEEMNASNADNEDERESETSVVVQAETKEEDDAISLEELKEQLDHLQVLISYLDKDFAATTEKLERLAKDESASFDSLWALFQPGEVAVCDHDDVEEEQAFVVKSVSYEESSACGRFLSLSGQLVEHTGSKLQRSWMTTRILKFRGTRKLASLNARPLTEAARQRLTERGRRYLIGTHFLEYEGSLIQVKHEPNGQKLIDKRRADGRVMVDRASYRRMMPAGYGNERNNSLASQLLWDDELDCQCDACMGRKPQDIVDTDYDDTQNSSSMHKEQSVPEKDLILLPPFVFGYSLVVKAWGMLLLEGFREVTFAEHAFDHLVLDEQHKRIVRALVESTSKEAVEAGVNNDVIQGKSTGVIILLHGPPGVGKTLLAESVSEHLRRPLYMVSSGALGDTAEHVERTLVDTLELARTWSAVLLIDEADVFLEARGEHEMARNALVAVFLRTLEYYSGLLILTTNRVKSFDAAFASRISVAIRFRDLSFDARKVIWRKFLALVGCEITSKRVVNGFSGVDTPPDSSPSTPPGRGLLMKGSITEKELNTFAEAAVNGRVIKQLVRAAIALAMTEKVPLSAQHIQQVLAFQKNFSEDLDNPSLTDMYEASDGSSRSARPSHTLYG